MYDHFLDYYRLSADVQYLIDPGLEENSDDTLILGLRTLVLF